MLGLHRIVASKTEVLVSSVERCFPKVVRFPSRTRTLKLLPHRTFPALTRNFTSSPRTHVSGGMLDGVASPSSSGMTRIRINSLTSTTKNQRGLAATIPSNGYLLGTRNLNHSARTFSSSSLSEKQRSSSSSRPGIGRIHSPLTSPIRSQRGLAGTISHEDFLSDHASTSITRSHNPMSDFDSAQIAYESRTNWELIRAFLSFRLCQIQLLVEHSEQLLKLSRRVLGDGLTDKLLKATLYGHFCAGEDRKRIRPVLLTMEKAGVGGILDYVAEADSDEGSATTLELSEAVLRENNPNARVYEYVNEATCDQHTEITKKCIEDVAALEADGYAAVKVSGLVDTKLLARMSRAIVETRNLFNKFDTDQDGFISREDFEHGYKKFFKDDKVKMNAMLHLLEERPGMIDYVSWSMMLQPQDLPQIVAGCRKYGPLSDATPTAEELEMMERLYERMHSLARCAATFGARLLIDAEQALFQPAIDNLVLDMQRAYNDPAKTDHPVVYNTYQCYLKDSNDRLRNDLDRARRQKFHFGAKLVRGAYMESERELAKKLGYESPIHNGIEGTHASFDGSVRFLLEQSKLPSINKVEIMLASHNQESILKAIGAMNDLGVDRRDSTICFAQLYGMMDNVSYALGKLNYRVFKYVPYGEVKMAMPYLARRAKENSSISGGAARELGMIKSELWRRLTSWKN